MVYYATYVVFAITYGISCVFNKIEWEEKNDSNGCCYKFEYY